jgi:hypothetical protein
MAELRPRLARLQRIALTENPWGRGTILNDDRR